MATNNPRVSIFSYNMLAQCYVKRPWDPNQWAGVMSRDFLQWEYRWPLIQQTCIGSNADIICLQEVELNRWEGEILPFFVTYGYSGVLQNDKNKKEGHPVGVAILYRTDRFDPLIADHRSRALLVFLQLKDVSLKPYVADTTDTPTTEANGNGNGSASSNGGDAAASAPGGDSADTPTPPPQMSICIANVHLEGEPRRVADRLSQFKSTLKQVRSNQKTLGLHTLMYDCVCVCGDFNASENSSVYKAAVEGRLSKDYRDPWFPDIPVTESDYTHDFTLRSAYVLAEGKEPAFTYANLHNRLTVDFMLVTPATLRPVSAREPCSREDAEDMGGHGLPNFKFGSDHLPICCEFEVLPPTVPAPKKTDTSELLPTQPSKKMLKKLERQQQKADKKQTKETSNGNGSESKEETEGKKEEGTDTQATGTQADVVEGKTDTNVQE
eukprot:GDKI01027596.1.p1 GENE.GDKI01027596.1~~GDKI01027596.1.p1  ORF type:complete len:450 (-),score=131.93 GDKI01027596.1:384-1700(-)